MKQADQGARRTNPRTNTNTPAKKPFKPAMKHTEPTQANNKKPPKPRSKPNKVLNTDIRKFFSAK